MSWIFGYIGKTSEDIISKVKEIPDSPFDSLSHENFSFCFGNKRNTLVSNIEFNKDNGWIVLGLGLLDKDTFYKIMTKEDWEQYLGSVGNSNNVPNGHYIIIRWNTERVLIYSDPSGLRKIYLSKYFDGFIISTRLDWLGNFCSNKINFFELGSRWLLFNQLSQKSLLYDTVRIVSGLMIEINAGRISITNFNKKIVENKFSEEDFISKLKKFLLAANHSGYETSLSLSGGFDSRVILALILYYKIDGLSVHTFGDEKHPDSIIAKQICHRLNIKHYQFSNLKNDLNYNEDELKNFVGQTLLGHPISAIKQLSLYEKIEKDNLITIDGGFGEIWRREFLNRILVKGRIALKTRNIESIYKYLFQFKADVFSDTIINQMKLGCLEQIKNIFNTEEKYKTEEDRLDSIAINTRLVNYYGHEQARLDNIVSSFMPFAQFDLIKNLHELSLEARKNGRLFKRIIRETNPSLEEFRLVKGQVTLRYGLPTIIARIYSKLLKKIGKVFEDNNQHQFLLNLQPKVFDIINSRAFRECEYYNHKKVVSIAHKFYQGDVSVTTELDWWLTFEIFRQNLENNS